MTSIRDHSFHLDSPGQSVMERAGVPAVLYAQCILQAIAHNILQMHVFKKDQRV